MVFITSYYEGIKYQYLMVKDGNSVNIDLIDTSSTEEDNGLEVKLDNIRNIYNYTKYLDTLVFFPNLYISGSNSFNFINNTKIKYFNNFAVSSTNINDEILLGNVLYPLKMDKLNEDVKKRLSTFKIFRFNVAIKFNIGELEVTPNRENILYSTDTINKINERINSAIDEIYDLIAKHIVKDYNNLFDYLDNSILRNYSYNIIEDSLYSYNDSYDGIRMDPYSILIYLKDKNRPLPTYKGKDLYSFITNYGDAYVYLKRSRFPGFAGILYSDIIYTTRIPYTVECYNRCGNTNAIILSDNTKLSINVRAYLKHLNSNSSVYAILKNLSKDDFIDILIKDYPGINASTAKEVFGEYYDRLYSEAIHFNQDCQAFLDYKNSIKKDNKHEIIKNIKIKIIIKKGGYCNGERTYSNLDEALKDIKAYKSGVIITNKRDNKLYMLEHIATLKKLTLLSVNLNILPKFAELPNYINPDDIIGIKSSYIRKLITYKNIIKEDYDYSIISAFIDKINKEDLKAIKYYENVKNEYYSTGVYSYININFKENTNIYDEYLVKGLNLGIKYTKIFESFKRTLTLSSDTYCGHIPNAITTYFIVKSKLFRVNKRAYLHMAHSEIIKSIRK